MKKTNEFKSRTVPARSKKLNHTNMNSTAIIMTATTSTNSKTNNNNMNMNNNNNKTSKSNCTVNVARRRSQLSNNNNNNQEEEEELYRERNKIQSLTALVSEKLNLSYRMEDTNNNNNNNKSSTSEAISHYLESLVADMVYHINHNNNNNNNNNNNSVVNIDRNIILLKELLVEEKVTQWGFTTGMIAAGVPELIDYYTNVFYESIASSQRNNNEEQEKEDEEDNNDNISSGVKSKYASTVQWEDTILNKNKNNNSTIKSVLNENGDINNNDKGHSRKNNNNNNNNSTLPRNKNNSIAVSSLEEIPVLPLSAFLPSLVQNNNNNNNTIPSSIERKEVTTTVTSLSSPGTVPHENTNNNTIMDTVQAALRHLLLVCQRPLLPLSSNNNNSNNNNSMDAAVGALCTALAGILNPSSDSPNSNPHLSKIAENKAVREIRCLALTAMESQLNIYTSTHSENNNKKIKRILHWEDLQLGKVLPSLLRRWSTIITSHDSINDLNNHNGIDLEEEKSKEKWNEAAAKQNPYQSPFDEDEDEEGDVTNNNNNNKDSKTSSGEDDYDDGGFISPRELHQHKKNKKMALFIKQKNMSDGKEMEIILRLVICMVQLSRDQRDRQLSYTHSTNNNNNTNKNNNKTIDAIAYFLDPFYSGNWVNLSGAQKKETTPNNNKKKNNFVPLSLPALTVATLANTIHNNNNNNNTTTTNNNNNCTAVLLSDTVAPLCMDLLWSLVHASALLTTRALYYGDKNNNNEDNNSMEYLFGVLVYWLNQSHRARERELRNDLVAFLTGLLRTDSGEWKRILAAWEKENKVYDAAPPSAEATAAVPYEEKGEALLSQLDPPPAATTDAINAIVLLLMDLSCGAELNLPSLQVAPAAGGRNSSNQNNNGTLQAVANRVPLLTQKSVQLYSHRFHGVASPTLRRTNIEFKRLAWQLLESFAAWQATVLKGISLRAAVARQQYSNGTTTTMATTTTTTPPPPLYDGMVMTDVCQLGLLDVLLLYVDLHCDHPVVTDWTKEELMLLQTEAWQCIASLLTCTSPLLREVDVNLLRSPIPSKEDKEKGRRRSSGGGAGGGKKGNTLDSIFQRKGSRHVDAAVDEDEDSNNNNTSTTGVPRMSPPMAPGRSSSSEVEGFRLEPKRASLRAESSQYHPKSSNSNNKDKDSEAEVIYMTLYEEEVLENIVSADVHFYAAGGVPIALRFIHEAPDELEVQKRLALSVIAAVMRHGGAEVKEIIASNEELVPLVVRLLDGIYRSATGEDTAVMQEGGETNPNSTVKSSSKDFHLTPAAYELSLECFSLLKNIGDTTAQLMGSVHEMSTLGTQVKLHRGEDMETEPSIVIEETETTWRHRSNLIRFLFRDCGGVVALVKWLRQIVQLNTVTTTNTTSPLSEAFLYRHLDLLSYALHLLNSFIGKCGSNADEFIAEGGMSVLLGVVESFAIATQALPASYWRNSPLRAVWEADADPIHKATMGYPQPLQERKKSYREMLIFSLSVTADLVYRYAAAGDELLQWHCFRLPRLEGEGRESTRLSAAQLLLKLFESDVKLFRQQSDDAAAVDEAIAKEEEEDGVSEMFDGAKMGLQLLHIYIRRLVRRSFRGEFIRRLLRRKMETDGDALSIEDLFLYDCYLNGIEGRRSSLEKRMAAMDEATKNALVEEMTHLSSITEEEHDQYQLERIRRRVNDVLPIGIKVYACLSSAGLECFSSTSAHPVAASLTPAERAVLVLLVALPSLLQDEVCLAMAEVAKVYYDEPPSAEETESAVGMRPTPADYRCLASLVKDIYARSQELRQLVQLDQHSHQVRQKQLFDRFLVTRIQESGEPAVSARRSTVVVPLSPESSQRGNTLANTLSTRLADQHSRALATAPSAVMQTTFNKSMGSAMGRSLGGSIDAAGTSKGYNHSLGGGEATTMTTTAGAAKTVPRAPKNKVQLKRKKEEMIKNSLRKLPQSNQEREESK